MTFGGRHPLVEEDLWWRTAFGERQPSVEDDLLVEDDLRWKTTFSGSLHAAYSALRHFF